MTTTSNRHRDWAADYARDGYLILRDAFDAAQVRALCDEATRICRNADGSVPGQPPAAADETDEQVWARCLAIHFPHKLSPLMTQAMRHPPVVDALTAVIGPDVKCMQSMLFFKGSGKPGQAWHQDEIFIPTRDRSLAGAWIALDRASVDNGCLWVIPGSHRDGILWRLQPHGDPRFDGAPESTGFPYERESGVPVELDAGSVVIFNGYLLHRSLPNRAPAGTFRRALVNHYMSARSMLPWATLPSGEDVATYDFRDVVMVAGKDPYAWRAVSEEVEPYVRSER